MPRGLFDPIPEVPPLTPEQRKALERKWAELRYELEVAMEHGEIPGSGFLFDPRLEVLQGAVFARWQELGDESVFAWFLSLVEKMANNYGASVLGLAILRGALTLAHEPEKAALIADREVAYYARHGAPRIEGPRRGA